MPGIRAKPKDIKGVKVEPAPTKSDLATSLVASAPVPALETGLFGKTRKVTVSQAPAPIAPKATGRVVTGGPTFNTTRKNRNKVPAPVVAPVKPAVPTAPVAPVKPAVAPVPKPAEPKPPVEEAIWAVEGPEDLDEWIATEYEEYMDEDEHLDEEELVDTVEDGFGDDFEGYQRLRTAGAGQCLLNAFLTIFSENYRKIPYDAKTEDGEQVRLKIGTEFRTKILPFLEKAGEKVIKTKSDMREVCKVGEHIGENIGFEIARFFGKNLLVLIEKPALENRKKTVYTVMPTPDSLQLEDAPWIVIYLSTFISKGKSGYSSGGHYEATLTAEGDWELDWDTGKALADEYGGEDKAKERAGINIRPEFKCAYVPGQTRVTFEESEWLVADREFENQTCTTIYLLADQEQFEAYKAKAGFGVTEALVAEFSLRKVEAPFTGVTILSGAADVESSAENSAELETAESSPELGTAESSPELETAETTANTSAPRRKSLLPPVGFSDAQRLQKQIKAYVETSKYDLDAEEPYASQESMRIFQFVKDRFADYTLPPLKVEIDPNACAPKDFETYPYQKFVREYIRQASPYRGLLVYHGLGSGKTCTSIAAAEALYSNNPKQKLIVMTPIALKENFLTELSSCGFRHYRYQNVWSGFQLDGPMELFATANLELPASYITSLKAKVREQQKIWIPDLSQPDGASNYDDLEEWEKKEIREQIRAYIQSKITFIGYTGIQRKPLMELILERAFDNAVIVVDEIHNLTRLMANKLEKYLVSSKSTKGTRRLKYEPITVDDWESPKYLDDLKKYDRGLLFYRLLAEAKNTKIIALSGTPIVNFPTEVGYLCNMLHGYFHTFKLTLTTTDPAKLKTVETYCLEHPCIGFWSLEKQAAGTNLFCALTNWGYKKVLNEENALLGLQQLEDDEEMLTIQEVYENLKEDCLTAEKIPFVETSLTYEALPLFPVDRDEFVEEFIHKEDITIKHASTFMRRIAGLISYYKGYKKDYMPLVTKDESVNCEMSPHQQESYSAARIGELKAKPKKKASKLASMEELDQEVSSYRFMSRSRCNFVFPKGIERPYPEKAKDMEGEIEQARIQVGETTEDFMDTLTEADEADLNVFEDELEEDEEEEEGEGENPFANEDEEEGSAEGSGESVASEDLENSNNEEENENNNPLFGGGKTLKKVSTLQQAEATPTPSGKKLVVKQEPYPIRLNKAMAELRKQAPTLFKLDPSAPPEQQLQNYSTKYVQIYERIVASKGSSLVYSNFKTVEGLGVFGIALETNGFDEIKLEGSDQNPVLSKATIASFKDRSKDGKRFLIYSGSQTIQQRQLLINIFNMRLEKLPASIVTLFREQGLLDTKNQKGEAIRAFMITGAGAEGLSLKNVRTVHIMEPHWNKVRTDQVKGRAVRICSHADLPYNKDPAKNERTVEVYTYLANFGKGIALDTTIELNDGNQTTDQFIQELGERKSRLNGQFTEALQKGAIDCQLNANENRVQCQVFAGTERDFLYDPRLDKDIQDEKKFETPVQPKANPLEGKKDIKQGTTVIAYVLTGKDGIERVYDPSDLTASNPLGTKTEWIAMMKAKAKKPV